LKNFLENAEFADKPATDLHHQLLLEHGPCTFDKDEWNLYESGLNRLANITRQNVRAKTPLVILNNFFECAESADKPSIDLHHQLLLKQEPHTFGKAEWDQSESRLHCLANINVLIPFH
jgi:hypothetical protein